MGAAHPEGCQDVHPHFGRYIQPKHTLSKSQKPGRAPVPPPKPRPGHQDRTQRPRRPLSLGGHSTRSAHRQLRQKRHTRSQITPIPQPKGRRDSVERKGTEGDGPGLGHARTLSHARTGQDGRTPTRTHSHRPSHTDTGPVTRILFQPHGHCPDCTDTGPATLRVWPPLAPFTQLISHFSQIFFVPGQHFFRAMCPCAR